MTRQFPPPVSLRSNQLQRIICAVLQPKRAATSLLDNFQIQQVWNRSVSFSVLHILVLHVTLNSNSNFNTYDYNYKQKTAGYNWQLIGIVGQWNMHNTDVLSPCHRYHITHPAVIKQHCICFFSCWSPVSVWLFGCLLKHTVGLSELFQNRPENQDSELKDAKKLCGDE